MTAGRPVDTFAHMFSMPDLLSPRVRPGKVHVESYFLKANDPSSREALWIKFTFLVTCPPYPRSLASVWAVHFDSREHRAFKETWPMSAVTWGSPLDLRFGECRLTGASCSGRLEDPRGSISWDLSFSDASAPLLLLKPLLMRTPLPPLKFASPLADATFSGAFTLDGGRREVSSWRGMLGHNWGTRHNPLYAWAHCNTFDSGGDAVFEAGTSRLALGPIPTPMLLTLALRREGRTSALIDSLSPGRRSDLSRYRWFFSAREGSMRVEGVIQTVRDDLVGLYYDNPDGSMTYCLNTKLAHARIYVHEQGREDVVLGSSSAAFEIGTTDPHHGVRMYA